MILSNKEYVKSLNVKSKKKIEVECDYCNCKFNIEYRRYIERNNDTGMDFCKSCVKIKNVNSFLISIGYKDNKKLIKYLLDNNYSDLQGVYSITNKLNNKIYIGSSRNIIKRWQSHIKEMRYEGHYVKEFNNIEINNLDFKIEKEVYDKNILIEEEFKLIKYYNDKLNNVYNTMFNYNNSYKYEERKGFISLEERINRSNTNLLELCIIKNFLSDGMSIKEVSENLNVSYNLVQGIKSLKYWDDVLPELNDKISKLDVNRKGSNNSCSKLKEEDVKEIKLLLKEGKMTKTDIGRMFGVSRTLIGHIQNGKLWSFVEI